jgi:hypothetical protein
MEEFVGWSQADKKALTGDWCVVPHPSTFPPSYTDTPQVLAPSLPQYLSLPTKLGAQTRNFTQTPGAQPQGYWLWVYTNCQVTKSKVFPS